MGEEFHAVLKLITGEEIFSLVSVDENDGDSIIMLSNPVIMKMLSSPAGKYVYLGYQIKILFFDQMIKFYNRYLNEDDVFLDGQI